MWPRRLARLLVVLLVFGLGVAALFVAVKPFRVSILTLALVPELLDDAPRPLSAVTPLPERVSVTYGEIRRDRMDIYIPRSSPAELGGLERHPTLILALGVNPLPLDDDRVVRTATALARLGLLVAVPESEQMRDRRIAPGERDHFISAFELVAARPDVDPGRIGIAAFSVGAGIALVAAADPRIADRVQYVNSFGGYGHAPTLLVELATRSVVVEGRREPWVPNELARQVFLRVVLGMVEDHEARERLREEIEPVVLGDGPTVESYDPTFAALLESDARAAYRLATARHPSVAELAIRSLSAEARADLAALSPNLVADRLRARIFLMHDEGDHAIPFSQLAPLAESIPNARLARVSRFDFFDHVSPRGVEPAAIPELWRFFRHLEHVANAAL